MIQRALTFFLAVSFSAAGLFTNAHAAKFPVPWLSGPVIDEVGWLNPDDKQQIEAWIRAAHKKGLAQLQVYIPKTLGDFTIEEVAITAASHWQLGDKKRDDGVLFILAPNERKLRIEVGQGLEGELTDLYSKRIIDYVVLPHIREGNPSRGVRDGVAAILTIVAKDVVGNEARTAPQARRRGHSDLENWVFLIVVVLVLLIRVLLFLGGGRRRFFGHRGGFLGSSGGFGSGGGGGWSGGGGGFSGGGSSGSW